MTAKLQEEWIPKGEAAALLGVSLRQLERREAAGYIEKRVEPRKPNESTGRVTYSRADLVALKNGTPNTHAVPVRETAEKPQRQISEKPENGAGKSVALARLPEASRLEPTLVDQFMLSLAGRVSTPAPTKPWLTLTEAVEYSGLPAAYLKKKALEGVAWAVDVGMGGDRQFWRFNRDGLQAAR